MVPFFLRLAASGSSSVFDRDALRVQLPPFFALSCVETARNRHELRLSPASVGSSRLPVARFQGECPSRISYVPRGSGGIQERLKSILGRSKRRELPRQGPSVLVLLPPKFYSQHILLLDFLKAWLLLLKYEDINLFSM